MSGIFERFHVKEYEPLKPEETPFLHFDRLNRTHIHNQRAIRNRYLLMVGFFWLCFLAALALVVLP